MAVGSKILAAEYNNIQSVINQILGTGSLTRGYGQSVSSSQVLASAIISTTQWRNLRTDILRCRQHQTGNTETLTYPTTDIKISEADRAAYAQMAADADTNRLVAPPANQATRENLVSTQTRTANWNGTLTQTVTVDFLSAEAARFYFNSGSRIEFSSSRTGGLGTVKDVSWTTLLSGMGTIYFGRSTTTCTGSGIGTSIGWDGLTSTNQLIFEKDVSGTTYYPNKYVIYCRAPSATQMIFTIQWQDNATTAGIQSGGPPTRDWGIDEDVTGNLSSTVQVYRADSDNVRVTAPSGSTTSF